MKESIADIIAEFKAFYTSKGVDIILPPLLFALFNTMFDLKIAIIVAVLAAVFLGLRRLVKKDNLLFVLGGLLGVIFASGLAYFSDNAVNYFLPKLLTSGGLAVLSFISLLLRKPITMWTSHLTRHWPVKWYERKDIYPAYKEVALIWVILFLIRFSVIGLLILKEDLIQLAFMNILLGTPFTIFILTISYLYGVWRLRTLKGPSVKEYLEEATPPFEGQRKGF